MRPLWSRTITGRTTQDLVTIAVDRGGRIDA